MVDSTIRTYVYDWSRPCVTTGECPRDHNVLDSDAAQDVDKALSCPSSVTPHHIWRWVHRPPPPDRHARLDRQQPVQHLFGEKIIGQHYDVRSEDENV